MVGIVDYRAGNITSVVRALDFLGISNFVAADPTELARGTRIIFPGVGAAGAAMANLRSRGLATFLQQAFANGVPILGICLGTQIILDYSEEDGGTECLGIIAGSTKAFPRDGENGGERLKIPHIGWNGVRLLAEHPVFANLPPEAEFYFVHSYFPAPQKREDVLGITTYGVEFCAILARRNLVAVQFHPEKSGRAGLDILRNFARWSPEEGWRGTQPC